MWVWDASGCVNVLCGTLVDVLIDGAKESRARAVCVGAGVCEWGGGVSGSVGVGVAVREAHGR